MNRIRLNREKILSMIEKFADEKGLKININEDVRHSFFKVELSKKSGQCLCTYDVDYPATRKEMNNFFQEATMDFDMEDKKASIKMFKELGYEKNLMKKRPTYCNENKNQTITFLEKNYVNVVKQSPSGFVLAFDNSVTLSIDEVKVILKKFEEIRDDQRN